MYGSLLQALPRAFKSGRIFLVLWQLSPLWKMRANSCWRAGNFH